MLSKVVTFLVIREARQVEDRMGMNEALRTHERLQAILLSISDGIIAAKREVTLISEARFGRLGFRVIKGLCQPAGLQEEGWVKQDLERLETRPEVEQRRCVDPGE